MNRNEMKDAVQAFIDGGGKVTRLRYASEKEQVKAHRKWHHKDKAIAGSERSREILDKEAAKEKSMIFSKDERWSDDSNK
tara:strand:+ start:634 stop:873 length:240 start_codon:yes stop_codon:yes gene_type:complete